MYHTPLDLLPDRNPASSVASVDLDVQNATQIARSLARNAQQARPQLMVDCSRLKCLRTLGVSHVVSELLVLHKAGADVWLSNITPSLQRCLGLLKLNVLFHSLPHFK